MVYTVKQLADLAGVSIRTLHYYDEIGLLKPSYVGENSYRYYEDALALRLQQILLFRELGFSLDDIRAILDRPGFDLLAALRAHRRALEDRIGRLQDLIATVDRTIQFVNGEQDMSHKQLFSGFSEEEEKRYTQEARAQWGAETVDASTRLWNSYTQQQKAHILAEGGAIYAGLAALIGQPPDSPAVQATIARWHQHLRYFYEPTVEMLRGLGQLYVDHPDFKRNIGQFHPDLPAFMRAAIEVYCDGLEE